MSEESAQARTSLFTEDDAFLDSRHAMEVVALLYEERQALTLLWKSAGQQWEAEYRRGVEIRLAMPHDTPRKALVSALTSRSLLSRTRKGLRALTDNATLVWLYSVVDSYTVSVIHRVLPEMTDTELLEWLDQVRFDGKLPNHDPEKIRHFLRETAGYACRCLFIGWLLATPSRGSIEGRLSSGTEAARPDVVRLIRLGEVRRDIVHKDPLHVDLDPPESWLLSVLQFIEAVDAGLPQGVSSASLGERLPTLPST